MISEKSTRARFFLITVAKRCNFFIYGKTKDRKKLCKTSKRKCLVKKFYKKKFQKIEKRREKNKVYLEMKAVRKENS